MAYTSFDVLGYKLYAGMTDKMKLLNWLEIGMVKWCVLL